MNRRADPSVCYACDAKATDTADLRLEGGEVEPACERHARVNEVFASTPLGSIHLGNAETIAKIQALAAEIIAVDRTLGFEIRALILLATELAAADSGKRELVRTGDVLLDAGTICAFHTGLAAEELRAFVQDAYDLAAGTLAQANERAGVH